MNELVPLFYNGKNIPSFKKFSSEAKKLGISDSEINDFYQNQEIVQITRKYVTPKDFFHILSFQPMDRVFIDTMFIKRYKVALVVIIDLFSKFGFAKLFSNTLKDTGISSSKALSAFKSFLNEILKYNYRSIGSVEHDAGSEFLSNFKTYVQENGIDNKEANPKASKRPMSPVERFNRTIRMHIARYKGVYESRKLSQAIINDIVDEYNNTGHSSILNYTPTQALTDRDVIDKIYIHNTRLREEDKKTVPLPNIKVGDSVRVLLKKDTDKFYKTGQLWSKEIYTVEKYDKTVNQYLLSSGKKYQSDQLQVVDKEKFDKYNHKFSEVVVDEQIPEPRRKVAITRDIRDVLAVQTLEGKRDRKKKIIYDA